MLTKLELQETKPVRVILIKLTFIEHLVYAKVYVRLFIWLFVDLAGLEFKINERHCFGDQKCYHLNLREKTIVKKDYIYIMLISKKYNI